MAVASDNASRRPASSTATRHWAAEVPRAEPFAGVSERPQSTKACLGANTVHLTARFDERTATVLDIGALDNLGKGASGAAVQNMNLLLGLPEGDGLS